MDHDEPILEGEERDKVIAKCEEMLVTSKSVYFDVFEFEGIIDYYVENNELGKAMSVIDISLAQHPNCSELEIKKAKLLMERNLTQEALSMINRLIVTDKSNAELHILKGSCLADSGKLDEAKIYFANAVDLSIGNEVEETCYTCALAYIDNGLYQDAIPYLERAYNLNQSNTMVIYDLAYSYDRMMNFEKSIEFYKIYLDLDPYSDNAWYNLGIVYNKANEFSDAINAFDYAIAINEVYASAYFNKANTLANWEKYSEAIDVYKEYILVEKDNPVALYYIGECYEKLNEYATALEYYNKVLEIDRQFADAWFGIGIVNYYQDKFDDAKQFMEKAIELDNENSEYWLSYGNVVRAMDTMPKETLNAYKRASQINPYDSEPWLYLADATKQYKDTESAITILKNAMTYIDGDAEILFTLAAYNYDISKLDVALKIYLQAAAIDHEKAGNFFTNCTPTSEDKDMFLHLTKK